MTRLSLVLGLAVITGLSLMAWRLDIGPAELRAALAHLTDAYHIMPVRFTLLFFMVLTVAAAACLPVELAFTAAAGALFGWLPGAGLALIATTLGATAAFLAARHLLRAPLAAKFRGPMAQIDEGMAKDGGVFLLSLRLLPLFPFALVNLLVGLTIVSTRLFVGMSLIGRLPAALIYANAGTQLSKIERFSDILSLPTLVTLTLLALLPLGGKFAVQALTAR